MVKNLPTVERSTKIRFGKHALEDQAENTIVFNASNTEMQATTPGAVYLSPIRFREDFSDSQIVLLMYNKTTGEITESGSSASTAVEPPLSSVTGFGNTTPYTIEFNNPTTAFTAAGNVYINGDLEIQGNVQFRNGTITEIKNTDLVVEDRIIGIGNNNTQTGLDIGIIMNYPNQNVGIIHHGDENPKRLSIGYTQNTHTHTSILPDSNNITLDVLGDLKVQNDAQIIGALSTTTVTASGDISGVAGTFTGDVSGVAGTFTGDVSGVVGTFTGDVSGAAGTFTGDVSGVAGTFSGDVAGAAGTFTGDVSGVAGTFTGAVSGASITDGTGTLSGGAWSGSAATLTTAITIGGVSFDGSQDIVPTTFGSISATDGTFSGDVSGVAGTFSGDVSGVVGTFTGDVSGAAGTFSGDVSGVAGTFSGDVSGATGTFSGDVAGAAGTFSGDVSGVAGTFTGAVSGASITDGTGTLSGGAWSGSAATLTTARTIGGVSFDGSQDIVPTTFGAISATDGTFSGDVSAVGTGTFTGAVTGASYSGGGILGTTGTFSSTLSSAGFTATSAQINGIVNTTGNLSVNTNALFVDAANKKVGIGITPTANLDILGNINSSTGITSAAGGITATTGLFTGDGGALSNLQVSSITGDVTLGSATSGDYVQSMSGGDGITVTSGSGESSTPSVAVDLKANGGLVIESNQVALKLDASSITGTLAVADGGTGVTTSTGSTTSNVVLSDSPTLTGTLTGATANFSGDLSAVGGTFTGPVEGASYTGGAIEGTTGTFTGVLTVSDGTSAESNITGALQVTGGIGAVGNVYSGDLYASAGLDHCSYIGTSKIGYDGTNTGHAAFAHYDNMNGTDYAIKQDSAGATKLNAKTGISLGINDVEKVAVTSGGDFFVDTNTLYVKASTRRVGIGVADPNVELDVSGSVYASQNITAAGNVNAGRATVTDGLIINAGGVTKKFYSFSGEIPHDTAQADAAIKLTFSSNIFYAKIVAHLVEDAAEFSNMSLEVGGGSRAGGSSPSLKLGSVSVFGNTSTNPWNSTPDVSTTAGAIIIKPSTTINTGGGTATALYNLFIEYITPDATNGKLLTIHRGTIATAVKTFNY